VCSSESFGNNNPMNMSSPTEVIRVGAIEIRYILEGSDTGGALALFETTVPPHTRVPAPHRHVIYDETVYGLAGTCTFIVEGGESSLTPGLALFIPRGAVHQFVNRGTDTARFLVTITPGVLGPEFFREVSAVMTAGGPPDLKRIADIMQRHGLQAV
jgi:quercetin dioxygenase-like cupin family protein